MKKLTDELYEKIKGYAGDKSGVSLPELQAVFSIGYPEAKAAVERMRADMIIVGEPCGMRLTVNAAALSRRNLTREAALALRLSLRETELTQLRSLKNGREADIPAKKRYAALMKHGLVVECAGLLFHTLDNESRNLLFSLKLSDEDLFYEYCSSSLVAAIRESGVNCIGEVSFFPEGLSELAERKLAEGGRSELASVEWSGTYSMAKYAFIEAFLRKNSYDTYEEYMASAEADLCRVEACGLRSGLIHDTVSECLVELRDLTLDNIKEIKAMIEE